MPSLRGHMVFMSLLRDVLALEFPALAAAVAAYWPSALAGSVAPDAWYFTGQERAETHGLAYDQPATWAGAIPRWLSSHPELCPGRAQAPEVAAFVAGYLSHLGLDTWEQYQHPDFPAGERRSAAPAWYPAELRDGRRRQAALRALGEAPFPRDRLVAAAYWESAPVPARCAPDAVRRVAAGVAPALPLTDPWAASRINPLREMPATPEARRTWEAERAKLPPATDAEYAALERAATSFAVAAVREWWDGSAGPG